MQNPTLFGDVRGTVLADIDQFASYSHLAFYPGLLTPAFVACSTSVRTASVRRPGYEGTTHPHEFTLLNVKV